MESCIMCLRKRFILFYSLAKVALVLRNVDNIAHGLLFNSYVSRLCVVKRSYERSLPINRQASKSVARFQTTNFHITRSL